MNIQKLFAAINARRSRAKRQGLDGMPFEAWLALALASKWRKFGRRRTDYNFFRKKKSQPYTPENTVFGPALSNNPIGRPRLPPTGDKRLDKERKRIRKAVAKHRRRKRARQNQNPTLRQ